LPPVAARVADFLSGWRGLGRFWIGVLALLGLGAGILQLLGAPPPRVRVAAPVELPPAAQTAEPDAPASPPGRVDKGAYKLIGVAAPDRDLSQPDPTEQGRSLPVIAADGRTPMHVYAAAFNTTDIRPRVGILVAGIGPNEADSMAAVHDLPAAATLAISPYANDLDHIVAAARAAGHEYLLSIPMEPQGYPINDPDDRHALMSGLSPEKNLGRLHWVMSRIAGYVGVTSALGQMRGERLASDPEQLQSLLGDVAQRGLLFVDARPAQPRAPLAWNRSVDIVIDVDPVNTANLDAQLEALARLARDNGKALGLVSVPRPRTLERVAAWSATLQARGLILAPVSALVQPPAKQESDK
jgi:polysaccharide deacetylase 2 family uncharacterized protein YibQ